MFARPLPSSRPVARLSTLLVLVVLLGAACSSGDTVATNVAAEDGDSDAVTESDGETPTSNGESNGQNGDATQTSPSTESADANASDDSGDEDGGDSTTSTEPTGSTDIDGPVVCQYDPDVGGPNPVGMRSFLRFEDRELGGSAVVYENFGNATGDGAFEWQAVYPDTSALDTFDRFLAGEPVAPRLDGDDDLIADVAATFACEGVDAPETADVLWEPPAPLSSSSCRFDPALGENPLGMRSTLTVWQLDSDSGFPNPTSVMVFEQFGNAVGDGAGWHQAVFTDISATEALEIVVSDARHLADATGDANPAELDATLELIAETHVCSAG